MKVYLLTTGDGSDGDEWNVEGIYATCEAAERAKAEYECPRPRGDGTMYRLLANDVEEWDVQGAEGVRVVAPNATTLPRSEWVELDEDEARRKLAAAREQWERRGAGS